MVSRGSCHISWDGTDYLDSVCEACAHWLMQNQEFRTQKTPPMHRIKKFLCQFHLSTGRWTINWKEPDLLSSSPVIQSGEYLFSCKTNFQWMQVRMGQRIGGYLPWSIMRWNPCSGEEIWQPLTFSCVRFDLECISVLQCIGLDHGQLYIKAASHSCNPLHACQLNPLCQITGHSANIQLLFLWSKTHKWTLAISLMS